MLASCLISLEPPPQGHRVPVFTGDSRSSAGDGAIYRLLGCRPSLGAPFTALFMASPSPLVVAVILLVLADIIP